MLPFRKDQTHWASETRHAEPPLEKTLRSIDIHAHLTPQCFWQATQDGGDWHTVKRDQDGQGRELAVVGNHRGQLGRYG